MLSFLLFGILVGGKKLSLRTTNKMPQAYPLLILSKS